MVKWNPGKRIVRTLRALQAEIVRAILRADAPVPHRGGGGEQIGGSLAREAGAKKLMRVARWGAVLEFSKLGQKFMFFTRGTTRQKARPVPLVPDVAKLTQELQADAHAHYAKRAKGRP